MSEIEFSKPHLFASICKLSLCSLRVSTRGLDGFMAKELSKADEVVVVGGEILSGESVTKSVGIKLDSHGEAILLDDVTDPVRTKRAATLTYKDSVALDGRTAAQVVEEEPTGFDGNGNRPLSVVFTVTHQNGSTPLREIEMPKLQCCNF